MKKFFEVPKGRAATLFGILLLDLMILLSIYLIGSARQIPFGDMTRDPGTVTGNIFIGTLSYLGIMLWAATAAICFISAGLLQKIPSASRFFLASGLFTSLLALDDAFMIHEELIPRLLRGLIPILFDTNEWPMYIVYLIIMLAYFILFHRYILTKTSFPILVLALCFLGGSLLFDVFLVSFPSPALQPLFEDGIKFMGITLWLYYFFVTAIRITKPYIVTPP